MALALLAALPAAAQESSDLDSVLGAAQLPPARWFASTDPKKANNDYVMLAPGETRRIPLAKGKLERLWSTSSEPQGLKLVLEPKPRMTVPLLAGGVVQLGNFSDKAYTLFPGKDARGIFDGSLDSPSYLIATNASKEAAKWYYQATVRPPHAPIAALPAPQAVNRRLFKVALAPGEEKSVDSWQEPGLIYELSVSGQDVAATEGDNPLKHVRLKAAWEGTVAVDAPLLGLTGDLTSGGPVKNAVADFDGRRLQLLWPMPFEQGQIWLRNTSEKEVRLDFSVRIRRYAKVPTPYRFCAQEGQATVVKGQPVKILSVEGNGAFLGLGLAIKPGPDAASRTFAYLEGNESLIADGKVMEGTGTEDYFSSAWYYPEKPFFHAYEGMTEKIAMPPSVTAYRLHVPDPVPFTKNFRFDFEHGNGNNRSDLVWTWVAYWYQKAPISGASVPAPPPGAGQKGSSGPAGGNSGSPASALSRSSLWLVVLGGPLLGFLLYLSKRGRRGASGKGNSKKK